MNSFLGVVELSNHHCFDTLNSFPSKRKSRLPFRFPALRRSRRCCRTPPVGHFSSTDGPAWYFDANELPPFIRLFCRCCWYFPSIQEKPVQMSLSFKKSILESPASPAKESHSRSLCLYVACTPLSLFSFFVFVSVFVLVACIPLSLTFPVFIHFLFLGL